MSEAGNDLRRPVALVTGATNGIGRAVALKLAEQGFSVIVHGRDAGRGEAVVQEIVGADRAVAAGPFAAAWRSSVGRQA